MRLTPMVVTMVLTNNVANSQELMTAEQLIENSSKEEFALPVAMYVAGWRDGASLQLLRSSATLGDSGDEAGGQADFQRALGVCVGALGVADLVTILKERIVSDQIDSTQISATAALADVAIQLCQSVLPDPPTDG